MNKTYKGKEYTYENNIWYSKDKNGLNKKVGSKNLLEELNKEIDTIDIVELPMRGLGDLIKKFTTFLGIEQCDKCKRRQAYLNKKFNFHKINKDLITEEDIEFIGSIIKRTNKVLSNDEANKLIETYNRLFSARLEKCNCPGLYMQILDILEAKLVSIGE